MSERRVSNPRPADARPADARPADPRPMAPRGPDPRAVDARVAPDAGQPQPQAAPQAPPTPPAGAHVAGARQATPPPGPEGGGLLHGPDLEAVSRRWHDIQAGFVDQPQQAVKDADALVADLMERVTRTFAAERRQLEAQWSRGDQVSTEDLRLSLQRYRSFFQRLLSVH